ncbi:hypothetical protein ABD91_20820 [Lysinibacillus sphaericus]|uniref:hypothetical protein n=1 Tax=Lysinibacillus sphaericus TaxID=1421 RepID=UPI0018CD1921|nr:hypothetical protein [Lysinibacillus sphaericus]MBG9693186.1 hypothetical protein [Lysinibacillus sphaericus]
MNTSEFNGIGKALHGFILLKKASEIVQAYKDNEGVELHEMEIAQLFTLSYRQLNEDEFSIDLIIRVYDRIQNEERHNRIIQAVKEWTAEKKIDLDLFLEILRTESA